MLPTPDTSHVSYDRVYEPSEDSFLLLDTLSSPSETAFLTNAFPQTSAPPLVVELGTGSGVVLAFVNAHAKLIFGSRSILTAGIDMNAFACQATIKTVKKAQAEQTTDPTHGLYLGSCMGDLTSSIRKQEIDVLIFNPPYVPTPDMPSRPVGFLEEVDAKKQPSFEDESYLLSLSYAGGRDGMETTDRLIDALPELLSQRGVAYILLCQQNKPDEVKSRIKNFGDQWRVEMVGSSGKTAGWEKLQVIRIWREEGEGIAQ